MIVLVVRLSLTYVSFGYLNILLTPPTTNVKLLKAISGASSRYFYLTNILEFSRKRHLRLRCFVLVDVATVAHAERSGVNVAVALSSPGYL